MEKLPENGSLKNDLTTKYPDRRCVQTASLRIVFQSRKQARDGQRGKAGEGSSGHFDLDMAISAAGPNSVSSQLPYSFVSDFCLGRLKKS